MNNKSIGICDSGVGGIAVLSEIIKTLPEESYIYLGDTARFPYGSKSKESLIKYTKEMINFLINQDVKVVVVACGTASSVLPEVLEQKYPVPIIGILEPTLIRIDDNTKEIGIIATSRTITSKAWDKIVNEKYPNINIITNACPILAPLAEAGWTDNEIARLVVQEYIKPFKNSNISELILGCTHYPLFKELIQEELPGVKLIDIDEEMGIYLKEYLTEKELLSQNKSNSLLEFNLTDLDDSYYKLINNLMKEVGEIKADKINKIDL